MDFKIVADSSSDVLALQGAAYACAPLTIEIGPKSFVDDASLDVDELTSSLRAHKGKTSTACPGTAAWLEAFGDAERIVCITITSKLSGTYNAAKVAAREYEEHHPGRRVFVLDSLSTGPEMRLLIERAETLARQPLPFDVLIEQLQTYARQTRLLFALSSLHNLVSNGRVNPALGALVGLLGIRVVGRASEQGELEIVSKTRGEKKTLGSILDHMRAEQYHGGKVYITHCHNEPFACALRDAILADWPGAPVSVGPARGLCSYYAEEGGLLVGYET